MGRGIFWHEGRQGEILPDDREGRRRPGSLAHRAAGSQGTRGPEERPLRRDSQWKRSQLHGAARAPDAAHDRGRPDVRPHARPRRPQDRAEKDEVVRLSYSPFLVVARRLKRLDPARADPAFGVPRFVEARDGHALARLTGVDEAAVADVDPVVVQAIEEDDVPRLEILARHRRAELILLRGVVRKIDSDLRVHVPDQPRAVEAGRTRAAPSIGSADMLSSDLDDAGAGSRRCRYLRRAEIGGALRHARAAGEDERDTESHETRPDTRHRATSLGSVIEPSSAPAQRPGMLRARA